MNCDEKKMIDWLHDVCELREQVGFTFLRLSRFVDVIARDRWREIGRYRETDKEKCLMDETTDLTSGKT